ncbi:MAG: hypothetical protein U0452_14770 [Anaerolineae bacterium]
MEPFAYLSVLTSLVIGLGIARLLTGVGWMMQARGKVRYSWTHALWILNVFLFALLNWWILFRWRTQEEWTFFLLLFVLATPTITFLLTVLLFPENMGEDFDFGEYFFGNRHWFFALSALLAPLDAIDTALKGVDHLIAQGIIYPFTIVLITTLMIIGAYTPNRTYHRIFAVFFLGYLLVFIGINLRVLA